jgi:hypothetical protein
LEKARKSAKRRVGKAWGVVIFLVGTAKFSRKTGENAPYDSFFKNLIDRCGVGLYKAAHRRRRCGDVEPAGTAVPEEALELRLRR